MEFHPAEWNVFPADDFETAIPPGTGELEVEVMAQIRPNGRVMDHWRVATGGSRILDAKASLASFIPLASAYRWTVSYQKWPADLGIKRNMTTSEWADFSDLLKANELTVSDENREAVENPVVLEALAGIANKDANSASWRWAVCATEAERLEIQLQSLPGPLNKMAGKPSFRR